MIIFEKRLMENMEEKRETLRVRERKKGDRENGGCNGGRDSAAASWIIETPRSIYALKSIRSTPTSRTWNSVEASRRTTPPYITLIVHEGARHTIFMCRCSWEWKSEREDRGRGKTIKIGREMRLCRFVGGRRVETLRTEHILYGILAQTFHTYLRLNSTASVATL